MSIVKCWIGLFLITGSILAIVDAIFMIGSLAYQRELRTDEKKLKI